MSFMRHKAGPIAIDFGSYALRAIQLAGREERTRVLAAACHVYAPREDGRAPSRGEVIEALSTVLREQKFVGRDVVSALSQRELLIKNIRVPEMPQSELASAVRYEAIERIAGLADDAEIRFIPAGSVPGDADAQQEVIILTAPASVVSEHLALLSEVGLDSVGIDAPPCALFRPFERYLRRSEDQDQVNAFVDVGWSGMRIAITRGNRIVFTKSFDIGGEAFNRLVARSLSVDLADAGEIRRQVAALRVGMDPVLRYAQDGNSGGDERGTPLAPTTVEAVDAAVRAGWEKLGKEIGLCLRYYAVTFRGARMDSITCVGGESLDPQHLEYLSEVTGLSCRRGFPLRNMTFADALPVYEGRGAMVEWTTVVGLSMKSAQRVVEKVES